MKALQLWAGSWGDLASIAGLIVSLLGFAITIVAVLKSKSAAGQAAEAASKTKDLLVRSSAIADVSAAVVSMQEIKRLHRARAWAQLPDRYASLRERLIAIRSGSAAIPEDQLVAIRSAEEKFAELERRVDKALTDGLEPPRTNKFNDIVSAELDKLQAVLTSMKQHTKD